MSSIRGTSQNVLKAAGLKVFERPLDSEQEGVTSLIVAKDEAVLKEMKGLSGAKNHRRYGELMGFTLTMASTPFFGHFFSECE